MAIKDLSSMLRSEINANVQSIKDAGYKPETNQARIYKHYGGVVIPPSRKHAGYVRSFPETNKARAKLGLEAYSKEEYGLVIKSIADLEGMTLDNVIESKVDLLLDRLNRSGMPEDEVESLRDITREKVKNLSDEELSDIIKYYASENKEIGDPYVNVYAWLQDNVLGDKHK